MKHRLMQLAPNVRHTLSLAVLCLTVSTPLFAQEWTRFRGPNGSGVGKADLPATFDARDINWKVKLPGTGHSSPVLWGQRLFLTLTDDASNKRSLLCLSEKDGSIQWRKDFDAPTYRQHKENNYASSTPAVDEERVYVLWSTPEEYSLRALTHDGQDLWQANLGVFKSQHGGGTSPVLYKDLVIVTKDEEGPNAFVVALDRRTGKEQWRLKRKQTKWAASTPCVLTLDGQDQLIVTSMHEGIAALDPLTGKVIWQLADAQPERPVGSPVLCDDVIISACGEGGFGRHMFAVRAGTKDRKPEVVFKKVQAQSPPYVPTPVVKGDLLFTWNDQGVVTCLRAKTGEQVWQQKVPQARAGFFSSPVLVGDRLYCVDKLGAVNVVRASETYEFLGRTDLGVNEPCSATPALANGRMYVRTASHLFSIGGRNAVAVK